MTEVRMYDHVHGHRSGSGPFGFSVYSPYEPAPAPPPGPALLDDNESTMLNHFFTSMDGNHLDNDFWSTTSNLNFEWPELPPTFEGSTTSLPPHTLPSQRPHRDNTHTAKPDHLSSDVLAAASMLYSNGMDYSSVFGGRIFTENGLEEIGSQPQGTKHARYGSGEEEKIVHVETPRATETYTAPTDPQVKNTPTSKQHLYSSLQWGSDRGFTTQSYKAPVEIPTVEERTTELLRNLDCFESQSSAPNTRPPSPISRRRVDRNPLQLNTYRSPPSLGLLSPIDSVQLEDESRPAKRRKSKGKFKEEEDDLSPISQGRSPPSQDRRWSTASGARARGSKVHVIKPPRENLTEQQKRANHILSEQKRRNLIKQGFDDLCSLVPELRGGGFSKSTMLAQAADWLQDLLQGNDMLKAQLEELKQKDSD